MSVTKSMTTWADPDIDGETRIDWSVHVQAGARRRGRATAVAELSFTLIGIYDASGAPVPARLCSALGLNYGVVAGAP